jgi:tRNA wybutosine-synthesizing protein 2
LKQSTGGWLHIHGNVNLTSGSDGARTSNATHGTHLNDSEQELGQYSDMLSSQKHLQCSSVTRWISYVVEKITMFLEQTRNGGTRSWSVKVRHIEHVKSYAPHIGHLVLDLECRPVLLCPVTS